MSYPKGLPNPTGEYRDFLVGIMVLPEATNLLHYRTAGGSDHKLWTTCVAQHIAEALQDDLMVVNLISSPDGERINDYAPTDEARVFWKNGAEQNMTPEEILQGWRALMSITKETDGGAEKQS